MDHGNSGTFAGGFTGGELQKCIGEHHKGGTAGRHPLKAPARELPGPWGRHTLPRPRREGQVIVERTGA